MIMTLKNFNDVEKYNTEFLGFFFSPIAIITEFFF